MTRDSRILCCHRVAELDPECESIVSSCDQCGAAVWVALSSPSLDKTICMQCFDRDFASNPDIKIESPTKRQLADLKRVLK
jgi:hypothetical protein